MTVFKLTSWLGLVAWLSPCLGGASESSSDTTTSNTDMRVVGGEQSTNVSAQNSTVTLTDQGAVHDAFGFGEKVVAGAFEFATGTQTAADDMVESAMSKVSDAYETAKAGEQRVFAGAVLAVVGIVAFAALKG